MISEGIDQCRHVAGIVDPVLLKIAFDLEATKVPRVERSPTLFMKLGVKVFNTGHNRKATLCVLTLTKLINDLETIRRDQ